ncbi:MAG: hypothetical protein ACREAB_07275 [Blastocatellia bacterium]
MPNCETCWNWITKSDAARHECPPRFECTLIEEIEAREEFGDEADEPEWIVVYARHPAQAAERFAARYMEGPGELRVRIRNEHGVEIDLSVEAEAVLRFDASPVGCISDPGYWDRVGLAQSDDFHKLAEPAFRAEAA